MKRCAVNSTLILLFLLDVSATFPLYALLHVVWMCVVCFCARRSCGRWAKKAIKFNSYHISGRAKWEDSQLERMERAEWGREEVSALLSWWNKNGKARVVFIAQTADENLPGRSDTRGKGIRGASMAYWWSLWLPVFSLKWAPSTLALVCMPGGQQAVYLVVGEQDVSCCWGLIVFDIRKLKAVVSPQKDNMLRLLVQLNSVFFLMYRSNSQVTSVFNSDSNSVSVIWFHL